MLVTGNNLYYQWPFEELMISRFRELPNKIESKLNYNTADLVQINWSYNIVKDEDSFYLMGFNNTGENVRKVKLPEDCIFSNSTVVGNDYTLLVVDKKLCKIWHLNLENETGLKCLNLKIETPEECAIKRTKLDDHIEKVALFNDCVLYLTKAGNVYCGFLPSHVDTAHCIGKIVDIQCGYEHFMLLTDSGRVYTWGNGRRLQLGHGDVSNLDIPTEIEALAGLKITKICAGGWHSLALSEFGDIYAWGWNDTGQLGITAKDKNSYSVPTLVDILDGDTIITDNVKDIACGSKFSAIVLEDNSIWSSGNNKYGQLGLPTDSENITGFKKVYQCKSNAKLKCGPWATVIIS